jgi:twitching motility two-component system response regulator PilG
MQGTLSEIDIRSILQVIALGQRTGELLVEAYPEATRELGDNIPHPTWIASPSQKREFQESEQFWFVFFVNGQIAYAAAQSDRNLRRLRDYLHHHKTEALISPFLNSSLATINHPEYACLWQLLEKKILTPEQGRNIIKNMIQETLFDLLSLHQGAFIFEQGVALAPQLTTLEIAPLLTKMVQQVQQWKQFYPHIQFPYQCLIVADEAKLQAALPPKAYQSLSRWTDGKTSLRQLARYLNRDLFTLAKGIYPYVERGWLQMIAPAPQESEAEATGASIKQNSHIPHIVCIDDDRAVGNQIEYLLQKHGYQSTAIFDPLEALSRVFEIKPDIILCDIVMPKLDGYEICAMLRRATAFRHTPIIMLTGQETFIDRLRARLVGATDYLTKPFGETELLLLLEKYQNSLINS